MLTVSESKMHAKSLTSQLLISTKLNTQFNYTNSALYKVQNMKIQ